MGYVVLIRNISHFLKRLPGEYVWEKQWAEKKNRKGRSKNKMLMGLKKELIEKKIKIQTKV